MGLFDIFRMGKILAGTAKAIREQRSLGQDLAEPVHGEFPAAVLKLDEIRLGSEYKPSIADRLSAFWKEHGNDSEKPGMLSILPPDNLAALATHSADSYLRPSMLDFALPLCEPDADDFVVLLLADAGENLPRGTVLEVEAGSATRYPGFKAWLGTRASLFGSMAQRFGGA